MNVCPTHISAVITPSASTLMDPISVNASRVSVAVDSIVQVRDRIKRECNESVKLHAFVLCMYVYKRELSFEFIILALLQRFHHFTSAK